MNPLSIASTFSIQKISKHHFLIRGDLKIKSFMKFSDFKWSDTYQGWIVNEDDEVDLIQMHMEVLDSLTEKNKKSDKASKDKKKSEKDLLSPYEKIKKGYDLSSSEDSDDETWEEASSSSSDSDNEKEHSSDEEEEEDHSSDEDYEPSSLDESESESSENESSENESSENESSESESSSSDVSSENELEDEKDNKKTYQFYKNGILGFGKISQKEQDKLKPIWNKYLKGWIFHKSSLDKLKHYGWKNIDEL
jgi:hypothetical protein